MWIVTDQSGMRYAFQTLHLALKLVRRLKTDCDVRFES